MRELCAAATTFQRIRANRKQAARNNQLTATKLPRGGICELKSKIIREFSKQQAPLAEKSAGFLKSKPEKAAEKKQNKSYLSIIVCAFNNVISLRKLITRLLKKFSVERVRTRADNQQEKRTEQH